jgi:hypothetical protein
MWSFADAYSIPFEVKIDGKWKSKHGDIPIEVDGNIIKGTLDIVPQAKPEKPVKTGGLLGMALGVPTFKKKSITLTGKIHNRGIIYNLRIYFEYLHTTLMGSEKSASYEGLMIVSENANSIYVMEKEEEKETSFYDMEKIDN